ncbi:MAG: hypothetical protein NTV75_01385 [Bacteroidia bacterium]|nr:hypothetical protein [Bacteroidia bacterium]
MKKLSLFILVAFLTIGTSFGQPQGDPAARMQKQIESMTSELGLSKDQVTKITPILAEVQKKQAEAFAKLRDGGGDFDREKMMELRNKITAETDVKLKTVLTPAQMSKLDAFRKKQAEERAKRFQQRQ